MSVDSGRCRGGRSHPATLTTVAARDGVAAVRHGGAGEPQFRHHHVDHPLGDRTAVVDFAPATRRRRRVQPSRGPELAHAPPADPAVGHGGRDRTPVDRA